MAAASAEEPRSKGVGFADAVLVTLALAGVVGAIWYQQRFARRLGVDLHGVALPVLIACVAAAALAARRARAVGGGLLVVTGATAATYFTVHTDWRAGAATAVALVLPGVVLLVRWWPGLGRLDGTAWALLALLGVSVVVVPAAGWRVLRAYTGPHHPESSTPAPPGAAEWMWAGAVTADSVRVTARVPGAAQVALEVVPAPGFDASTVVQRSDPVALEAEVAALAISGLSPGTEYHYRLVVDGRPDEGVGRFTTFPDDRPWSFTAAIASCARDGSNGSVYDAIRGDGGFAGRPDLLVVTGDLHYGNIEAHAPDRYRAALDAQLTQPALATLLREVPVAYTWDDHDYGANNSDSTNPGRQAVAQVYRQYVPHYPLAAEPDPVPVYQAFTAGRVRFVVTDTRSQRTPHAAADGPAKSVLGPVQRQWLLDELLAAHEAGQLVVWVQADPWIDAEEAHEDEWGGYAWERQQIADFIDRNRIDRLVMVSGDAHMVAVDDGADRQVPGTGSFPVLHAAALDRTGSTKGGPYRCESCSTSDAGRVVYPGGGQFGTLRVDDDGDRIVVTLTGWSVERGELISLRREFPG